MSPLDIRGIHKSFFGAHGWIECVSTPTGYVGFCHAIEWDEDDTARRCGWVGPERATLDEAETDAIRHHHDKEGRCRWCSDCTPFGTDIQ